jgi:tetratricopeptide (TPR) repeat protein
MVLPGWEGIMRASALALSAASLLVMVCASLPPSARAQTNAAPSSAEAIATPIGKVVSAKGSVTVQHVEAVVVQANLGGGTAATKVGDFVYKRDVVSTGADSAVGITFSDGTAFNLSSNARMELNEFVYNPKGKANSTLFTLSKGTFTFIAGKVANTGDMKIDTPVATMGIRGTAPRVEITADGAVSFSTLVEEGKTKTREGLKQLQAKRTAATDKGAAQQENPFEIVLKAVGLCNGLDRTGGPDSQIRGCTALIDSDEKTQLTLVHAYNNRGNAYTLKGDYDLAIKDYDESIKVNPKDSKAFYNRGLAYNRKGERDRAIADLDEAIKLDPYYTNAFLARAQVYEKKSEYDRALRDYDEVIGLQPTWGRPWNGRCWVNGLLGQLQAALSDCNEAIRLQPDVAVNLDSRGLIYLKMGEWSSAVADYSSALRLDPRLANSLYGRGLAKLKNGDTADGDADISAAKAIEAKIVEDFARYGVQ